MARRKMVEIGDVSADDEVGLRIHFTDRFHFLSNSKEISRTTSKKIVSLAFSSRSLFYPYLFFLHLLVLAICKAHETITHGMAKQSEKDRFFSLHYTSFACVLSPKYRAVFYKQLIVLILEITIFICKSQSDRALGLSLPICPTRFMPFGPSFSPSFILQPFALLPHILSVFYEKCLAHLSSVSLPLQ